jgi:hypothetical protein
VITNLQVGWTTAPVDGVWFAVGQWADIVDTEGRPFLPYHLEGAGRLPKRDIAGVRPEGRERAMELLRRFALRLVRRR